MIRFSAILAVVVAAVGLLVAGAVSGSLLVVYLAIGVAALALLMLIGGVLIWRDEIFGEQGKQVSRRSAARPERRPISLRRYKMLTNSPRRPSPR